MSARRIVTSGLLLLLAQLAAIVKIDQSAGTKFTYRACANCPSPRRRALSALTSSMSATRYVSPYTIACVYVALGDRTSAFTWLERAYAAHASEMYALKVDPILDPLHDDPRWATLVRRMGLN